MIFNLGSLIHPKQMLKLLKDHAVAKVNVVNIYNYLYKRKLNKLLITAFYVCFVLLLLTEILQFSLELSDMSLISYAFY